MAVNCTNIFTEHKNSPSPHKKASRESSKLGWLSKDLLVRLRSKKAGPCGLGRMQGWDEESQGTDRTELGKGCKT